MKKFFVFFLAILFLTTSMLSGCGNKAEDRQSELNEILDSTYEELTATFSGSTGQYDLVAQYLQSWASKYEIDIIANEEDYMILSNPATDDSKGAKTTALQCTVDTKSFSTSLQSLALSLTCMLGPESHGDISLIITETDNGEYTGAASINPKYLKCDNFINIAQNDDVRLYLSGSYESHATMSTNISTAAPSYPNAYNITMKISGHHDPFNMKGSDYPNPVEVIGNLLATEKSSGQLFQLSSFSCDTIKGYIPTSATAIVVIDDNDINSFEKKFKTSYNNMKKKFEKLEDNFVYTFTRTELPEQVMSSTTSDNIISLMYTLKPGTYLQDEDTGDVIATSEISNVTIKDGTFKLSTVFRSTDELILDEMSEVFLTTSGLCDIDYNRGDTHLTWPSKNNKKTANFFKNALGAEETICPVTLESSENDIFASKAKLRIISYQCNIHHGEAAISNITKFLETPIVE